MEQTEIDKLNQYLSENKQFRGLSETEYIKINKASERFTIQSIRNQIEIIKLKVKFKNLTEDELFDFSRLILPTCRKVLNKNKVTTYFLNLNKSR